MYLFYALIGILALAPLPFGSAPLFWQNLLAASCLFLATASVFTSRMRIVWPPEGFHVVGYASVLFGMVFVWIVLQATVPGPWGHPSWNVVEDILGPPVRHTISLSPFSSLSDALSLAGACCTFMLALGYARNAKRASTLMKAIVLVAGLYSLYGLLVFFTGNSTVAWLEKRHYEGSLTSTFVNRNSFGIFAGLGLVGSVALLLQGITSATSVRASRRERIRQLIEVTTSKLWPWWAVMLACSTALLLTGSRGATAATLVALVTLVLVYLTAKRSSRIAMAGTIVGGIAVGLFVFSISGDFLLWRIENQLTDSYSVRAENMPLLLAAAIDHAWFGVGYGAFEDAFAIYDNAAGPLRPRYVFAHNVFLELTIELGIPAALCLFTGVGLLISQCIRGIVLRRRDRIFGCFALASSVLFGFQGMYDFAIQTPALSVIYAAILGIGVAQSVSTNRNR